VTRVSVRIEGEVHLRIEDLSECYACETSWLREAYDFGLLGLGRVHQGEVVLSARRLDRVAEVVRLGHHHGLALETIAVVLGLSFLDE
jgi:hypothetical protein